MIPIGGFKVTKMATCLQRIGSSSVVQRFPFGWVVYFFALYDLGMVLGILVKPASLDSSEHGNAKLT